MKWMLNSSGMHYNLQLLSRWVLVASGTLIAFSAMIHYARKWIVMNPESRISKALSLDFFVLDFVTRIPVVRWILSLVLVFNAGAVTGWYAKSAQERNNERSYPIKVKQRLDERRAYVCKADENGNCVSTVFKWQQCPHEVPASFDAGKLYFVDFEISQYSDGECNTFTGERGKFEELPQ